jgi:arylsulfatase A-like enzyme
MFAYRDVQRALRDERWKLIRYPQVDRTQLFDLAADPDERVNLAERPEHAARVKEMVARLARLMIEHADAASLNAAAPQPAEWTPPAKKADAAKKG